MLFINLKTYTQGTGVNAKKLIESAEILYNQTGTKITFLVQTADLWLLTPNTQLPIWTQHIDNIEPGKNTGYISPKTVISAGAKGTMINHTEHKVPHNDIRDLINKYQNENFQLMVSSKLPNEAYELDEFNPSYISYEPSAYIGSGLSIIDVAPDLISSLVQKLKTPLVIGSGIRKVEHLQKGLDLGAVGFLISSSILLSDNPIEKLAEFMEAYSRYSAGKS